jgi:hypothetical protein
VGWVGETLFWVAFYFTVHFTLNEDPLSFWLPVKFMLAVPETLFCMGAVYSFRWLFTEPLDMPINRVLLFGLVTLVLQHVVYYYASQAVQPYAPVLSAAYRRWNFFMAGNGPFFFLKNLHYLVTVSSFLYFSMVCLPIGLFLLRDTVLENRRLAAAQQQQLTWELQSVRSRLNPEFFQQTLTQVAHLLNQQQEATAAEVTLKLAQLLRHTLYENRGTYVPLQRELDAYLDYMQLQELRLQDKVDVTLRLTVENSQNAHILAGVLLPLTEQFLPLAATYSEIEVRVRNHQLSLHLSADVLPDLLVSPEFSLIQRHLAHHTEAAHQLRYTQQGNTFSLQLELPLQAAALAAVS